MGTHERPAGVLARNPVLILNAVRAVLAVAVIFGLDLPVGAEAAILGAAEAILTLTTRELVTPAAAPRDAEGRPLTPDQ